MSIPHIFRIVVVCLCSSGLGMPASAFGGCCCGNRAEKTAQEPAHQTVKRCCGGVTSADKVSKGCLPESECRVKPTCAFCKVQTVVVADKQASPITPPADQPLALAWDVSVSKRLVSHLTADPPFESHNARLSQFCVWRK